jgi:hypothetical protein
VVADATVVAALADLGGHRTILCHWGMLLFLRVGSGGWRGGVYTVRLDGARSMIGWAPSHTLTSKFAWEILPA